MSSLVYDCPVLSLIEQKIEEKILHRDWQPLRSPKNQKITYTATQELKELLKNSENNCIQTFLQGPLTIPCGR
jgi:hypothetical protein